MDKKQLQMKEDISLMLSKKDYYDILGIPKTANETEIKKSYKKLALRFHPDKNSLQGSKQVFKKVSNAYSVLINPQKKQRYDRFGPQQQIQARTQQTSRQYYYYQNREQEFDDYEEIFRAFFGHTGMQRNRQHHRNHQGAGAHQNPGQRPQGFSFGYIFIIFFIIYTFAPYFKSKPYYSFNLSPEYRFKTNTEKLNTQYYANEDFFSQAKKDPNFKKQIDLKVDEEYMINLKKMCEKNTYLKKKLQTQAYQYRAGDYRKYYLNQANRVDVSYCRKFDKISQKHPDYVARFTRYL